MIVKIYGHAGQGVDLARRVIGDSCLSTGFFVQDVIFSGITRRKCDAIGYVKFDKKEILSKQVENPDISLVFDMAFEKLAISETNENGIIIFNSAEAIKKPTIKKKKIKCFHIDASGVTMKILSRKPVPNMPMLGALVKVFDKVSLKSVKTAIANEIGEDKEAYMEFEEGYKLVKRC